LGTLALIAVLWFGAHVVKNFRDQPAERPAAETKQGQFTKNAPKPDSTLVGAGDLGHIPLFELGSSAGPQWVSQVWGTVRNDLPRPLEKVQLKASIYDTAGRLIASETFMLPNSRLDPGVPIIFNQQVALNNLPTGYQLSIQAIEAHYVQPVSATDQNRFTQNVPTVTPSAGGDTGPDLYAWVFVFAVLAAVAVVPVFLVIITLVKPSKAQRPTPPSPRPSPPLRR
jgi:hypothetical protein